MGRWCEWEDIYIYIYNAKDGINGKMVWMGRCCEWEDIYIYIYNAKDGINGEMV